MVLLAVLYLSCSSLRQHHFVFLFLYLHRIDVNLVLLLKQSLLHIHHDHKPMLHLQNTSLLHFQDVIQDLKRMLHTILEVHGHDHVNDQPLMYEYDDYNDYNDYSYHLFYTMQFHTMSFLHKLNDTNIPKRLNKIPLGFLHIWQQHVAVDPDPFEQDVGKNNCWWLMLKLTMMI